MNLQAFTNFHLLNFVKLRRSQPAPAPLPPGPAVSGIDVGLVAAGAVYTF